MEIITTERQTRSLPVEVRAPQDAEGRIEAIVSVFDVVDSYNTRIRPGAFARSLERRLPVGVWAHNWEMPVAKTVEAREVHAGDPLLPPSIRDKGGLFIAADFNLDTQRGRDAYSDVKKGLMDEFSIGFSINEGGCTRADGDGVVDITEVTLFEFSPVVAGSNPATELISIRQGAPTSLTLDAHSEAVLATARELTARIRNVAELRATEGRDLNPVNLDRLTENATALEGLAAEMRVLAAPDDDPLPDPEPNADAGRASRLAALYLYEQELALAV